MPIQDREALFIPLGADGSMGVGYYVTREQANRFLEGGAIPEPCIRGGEVTAVEELGPDNQATSPLNAP